VSDTACELLDQQIKEAQFQNQVIDLAHACGWKVAHFRGAWTQKGWRTPVSADGECFPDLVIARPGRLIFAETKSWKGRLRKGHINRKGEWVMGQDEWLELLRATGKAEVCLWRPKDLDRIIDILH